MAQLIDMLFWTKTWVGPRNRSPRGRSSFVGFPPQRQCMITHTLQTTSCSRRQDHSVAAGGDECTVMSACMQFMFGKTSLASSYLFIYIHIFASACRPILMYDCLTLCLLARSQRPVCVKTRQTGPVGKGLNDTKSAECAFLQLEKPQLTFSCFHHKKHQILPQNWSFSTKKPPNGEDLTSKQRLIVIAAR